jgi:hypothetical protein
VSALHCTGRGEEKKSRKKRHREQGTEVGVKGVRNEGGGEKEYLAYSYPVDQFFPIAHDLRSF